MAYHYHLIDDISYDIHIASCICQGRIQDSEKGGAQFCYCEHSNCVQSTQSGMQSMPNLGGSGGMPN